MARRHTISAVKHKVASLEEEIQIFNHKRFDELCSFLENDNSFVKCALKNTLLEPGDIVFWNVLDDEVNMFSLKNPLAVKSQPTHHLLMVSLITGRYESAAKRMNILGICNISGPITELTLRDEQGDRWVRYAHFKPC